MLDRAVQRKPDRAAPLDLARSLGQGDMSEIVEAQANLRTAPVEAVSIRGRLGGMSDRWLAWWDSIGRRRFLRSPDHT